MIIYVDQKVILESNLSIRNGARESINELLRYSEIELWIVSEIDLDLASPFPELKDRLLITSNTDELKGDVWIDDDPSGKSFVGDFHHFDLRNPYYSWKNILPKIKAKLKNSFELSLYANFCQGIFLINNSNTTIKKIIIQQYNHQLTDAGAVSSTSNDLIFENISPTHAVQLSDTHMHNDAYAFVKYCEWEDGQILEGIGIQS